MSVALCPPPAAASPCLPRATRVTRLDFAGGASTTLDEALDRAVTLARGLGLGSAGAWTTEGASAVAVTAADHRMAAALGGVFREVASAVGDGAGVRAWRGPAFVPGDHLLSVVPPGRTGVAVTTADGHRVLHVFSASRPSGAAPGAASAGDELPRAVAPAPASCRPARWVVRLRLPHQAPPSPFLRDVLAAVRLDVVDVHTDVSGDTTVGWARVAAGAGRDLAAAAAVLFRRHRLRLTAWRVLDDGAAAPD